MLLHSEGQTTSLTVSQQGGSVVNSDLWSASFHCCPDPDPESWLQAGMRLEGSEATLLCCRQLGARLSRERWGGGAVKKASLKN